MRTSLIKIMMFGLSAALAGAAGWLFSFQGTVSPGQFGEPVAINILAMVILGGMNTTIGPILGAIFVSVFPVEVSMNPLWQEILFGGLLLVVVLVYPAGFVGLVRAGARRAVSRARSRRSDTAQPPSSLQQGTAERDGRHLTELAAVEEAAASGARLEGDALEAARALGLVATHYDATTPPAVECRGIQFAYIPRNMVLEGVDLVVKPGTIHGLIGPNGSGKSTLVDIIAGRLKPSAGTVSVAGIVMNRKGPPARARAGVTRTFQAAVLVSELRVEENVGIGYSGQIPHLGLRAPVWPIAPRGRRDTRLTQARSNEALRFVGAERWSRAQVSSIPHGVEQLTQLAAACAAGPRTVILDEPLAGLSPNEVEHVAAILAELKGSGVSVILIEHQPRFVFALCDEVTVLAAGAVVASGPAAEIREHQRVREVYLG
jgi:branched-chain amino acid transport system permease protein